MKFGKYLNESKEDKIEANYYDINIKIRKSKSELIKSIWDYSYGDANDMNYDTESVKGKEYILRHAVEIVSVSDFTRFQKSNFESFNKKEINDAIKFFEKNVKI